MAPECDSPAETPKPASAGEGEPPDSFRELHKALTEARERLGHLSRAAEAVAASRKLQQEVTALRAENQRLRAEIDAARAGRDELETARQAAEGRVAELTQRLEEATAKTSEVEEELAAARAESERHRAAAEAAQSEAEAELSQMRDRLQRAERERARVAELTEALEQAKAEARETEEKLAAAREQSEQRLAAADAELKEMRDRLQRTEQEGARVAELTEALEQARAEVREKEEELAAAREQSERHLAAANDAQKATKARLGEMRDSLRRAQQEKARVDADLARLQDELASAKEQVATAARQRADIEQRAAALQSERDALRTRLSETTARLEPTEAANAELEREVARLRLAARTAAEDTRQLIETLAAIGLSAGPLEADAALLAESGAPAAGDGPDGGSDGAAAPAGNVTAEAAPGEDSTPSSVAADQAPTRTARATLPAGGDVAHLDQRAILGGRPAVYPKLAGLPPERRDRVQGILAELPSKLEERGLMTTVPGELLFAEGSDRVQTAAYDTLAKVAELIGMYEDREVLIIGHSDARGDAARNQELSERRAARVKEILVDTFDIEPDRLSTDGRGATLPIASNATPEGRRANRRVEVLILN